MNMIPPIAYFKPGSRPALRFSMLSSVKLCLFPQCHCTTLALPLLHYTRIFRPRMRLFHNPITPCSMQILLLFSPSHTMHIRPPHPPPLPLTIHLPQNSFPTLPTSPSCLNPHQIKTTTHKRISTKPRQKTLPTPSTPPQSSQPCVTYGS